MAAYCCQVAQWVKNPSAMQEMQADMSLIPWWGRSSGGGRGNPLQYSHLENPMNRGAWQAMGLYGRKESGMSEAT